MVIGLDGATLNLVRPWATAGYLPNLARIMAEGASGQLRSTVHPMTPPAWTSFMTGKNLGKHGLVDFFIRKPGTYDLVMANAQARDGDSVWNILSASGKKVGVINVPMTYPPEEVNGLLISGMDTPSLASPFTYPPELKWELLSAVPEYRIEAGGHDLIWGRRKRYSDFIAEMFRVEEARFQATRYLMEKYPWDFLMVVFRATDRAQHRFWKHMDPAHPMREPGDEQYADTILKAYQQADEMVGYFMDHLPEETTLVIASDHGAAPAGDKVVYLNTWLRDQGFLTYKTQRSGLAQRLLRKVWTTMRRNLPSDAKRWLKATFPRLDRSLRSFFVLSEIDWARTRAFAVEPRESIWINLQGQDPQGTVTPGADYERTREEIITRLMEWRDPHTGHPVMETVYKREEIYHGPYMERIPDLLIIFSRNQYRYQTARQGPDISHRRAIEDLSRLGEFGVFEPSGVHDLDGLCLFWGDKIRRGVQIQEAQITDIAPTILYLMGEAVPEDMDGRVLEEAISDEFRQKTPLRKERRETRRKPLPQKEIYSSSEEQEIQARLRGLGYFE